MTEQYTTTVMQEEGMNATGIPVPDEVIVALGKGKKPPVKVTLNGHTYRTTVGSNAGMAMLPLSKENREAAGVAGGDTIVVTLELDTEPRTVEVPEDLAAALAAHDGAREKFDKLSPSARKEYVRQVESAKAQDTRDRRVAKIVGELTS